MRPLIGTMLMIFGFGLAVGSGSGAPVDPDTAKREEADRLAVMGARLHDAAEYSAADRAFSQALRLYEELGIRGKVATMVAGRASVAQDQARYLDARQLYRKSIDLFEHVGIDTSAHLTVVWRNLATLHLELRQYSQAERAFERALELDRQAYGPRHGAAVGLLSNLGWVRHAQSDHAGANDYYRQAFDHLAAGVQAEPPDIAMLCNSAGTLHLDWGELERAEASFHRGLDALGSATAYPVERTNLLINLGHIHSERGNADRAARLFGEAVAILEDGFGPDHLYVGRALSWQAEALRKLKRKEEAKRLARRGRSILREHTEDSLVRGTVHVSDLVSR